MEFQIRSSGNVEQLEVATALLEPTTLAVLSPFVQQERSPAGVARELGMPLNSLMYQIKRLLALKLLCVSRVEARAGRATKYYRAVAETFFVPYHLTAAETPELLLEQETAPRQKRLVQSLVAAAQRELDGRGERVWGLQVALEGERLVARNAIGPDSDWNFLSPTAPALLDWWAEDIQLGFKDAKTMQAELCDLLMRYRAKSGQQAYILRLAMAPITTEL
jgi:DNA-binding transcriptional ArsR family regulator